MLHVKKLFIFLFIILATFFSSKDANALVSEGSGHVKYYGFYGQGYLTNKLIADSANIAFVDLEEITHVEKNAENGIGSIIHVERLFFKDAQSPIYPDAQERWEKVIPLLESRALNGKIVAFYLYGEPYSNKASYFSREQTYKDLQKAAQIIRNTFSWINVMVVEQYSYLEPFMPNSNGKATLFPSEINWVGFDCYMDTFETCGDKGIPYFFNQVKSGLHGNQKIFLVPQIFDYSATPTSSAQDHVIDLNKKYLNLAQSSPEVVAVLGWIASNYKEPNNPVQFWGGLEDHWGSLENYRVRDAILENGRILLGRQPASLARDEQRVTDKNNIIAALQNYYKATGKWPQTSGAWVCLGSSSETCWGGNYKGLDSLVSGLQPYLPNIPTNNVISGSYVADSPYPAVKSNYAYNSYLYNSSLPHNNLGNGNPEGAYLIWVQENKITGNSCTNLIHPDKYWYCYEFLPTPIISLPPIPPITPIPPIPPVPVIVPKIDFKINGSTQPSNIAANSSANITWTATGATDCVALGNWAGPLSGSGSVSTGNLAPGVYAYSIKCTNGGQVATSSINITVNSVVVNTPPPPQIISPGPGIIYKPTPTPVLPSTPPVLTIYTSPVPEKPKGRIYNLGNVTLRNGSRGEAVKELQRFLNDTMNLGLVVDGKLGPKTIFVMKTWQLSNGLVPDGLIGPKTKAKINGLAI